MIGLGESMTRELSLMLGDGYGRCLHANGCVEAAFFDLFSVETAFVEVDFQF